MSARAEGGSVLVEFAFVSLVLWLLFAVSIDFGRLMFSAQALQDAARVAAREIAITPLPSGVTTFDAARDWIDPMTMQPRFFSRACLVIDLDGFADDAAVDAFIAQMPVVNRALRPLMIVDKTTDHNLLRYPGALLADGNPMPESCVNQPPTGFVVGIPQIESHAPETIRWIEPVEEIRSDPCDPTTGPFGLVGPGGEPHGIVGVRVNYPFEAAAISSFQPNPPGPLEFEPNIDNRNLADEGAVAEINPAGPCGRPGNTLADNGKPGPYTGPYGLGRQFAFASTVRPYSRVLSGQAIYRREVFLP